MFYYPHLLNTPNLVNLQVVIPGGWGQLDNNEPGLHFLWETLFFAPTKNIPDPDKWLWEHTLDFWAVTSFESIRLNFTLNKDQVEKFIPILKTLVSPRPVPLTFINQELLDLKTYWQTDRDQREDAVLRELFPNEKVVHPDPNLVLNLSRTDAEKVYGLWRQAKPHLIILGELHTDDAIALSQVGSPETRFVTPSQYKPPLKAETFFTAERWGLKFELAVSHLFELIVIELWEQQFNTQFFFEYHDTQLFIWTAPIANPNHLAENVKNYPLTKADFDRALNAYQTFLKTLYTPKNRKSIEKIAELTEGLHPHKYQAPTYGVNAEQLNLSQTISQIEYEDFKNFYEPFIAVFPQKKPTA